MLFDDTKKDVDELVLDEKGVLVAKLKTMKELNLKTAYEMTVFKTKFNAYV